MDCGEVHSWVIGILFHRFRQQRRLASRAISREQTCRVAPVGFEIRLDLLDRQLW